MNVLNLNYANMVNAAKEELNKIWIPNVGDFVINEQGMLGVLIKNNQQELTDGKEKTSKYVGVTLLHNGLPWFSANPIWMPRLDQIITLFDGISAAAAFIVQFNRWLSANSFALSPEFSETVELALSMYMDMHHNKMWNFRTKAWEMR